MESALIACVFLCLQFSIAFTLEKTGWNDVTWLHQCTVLRDIFLYDQVNLSQTQCDVTLDVAIVGAGVTGSYAAYRLRHKNKRIGIFEYSDRIGGRMFDYTLPNTPGVKVEMGAMRYIGGVHTRLESILRDLDLSSSEFVEGVGHVGRTRYFLRGKSISKHQLLYGDIPYNLSSSEKKNQHRLFEYYLEKLTGVSIKGRAVTPEELMNMQVGDGKYLYTLNFLEALSRVASSEGMQFIEDIISFKCIFDNDISSVYIFHDYLGAFGRAHSSKHSYLAVDKGFQAVAEGLVNVFLKSSTKHMIRKNIQLKSVLSNDDDSYSLLFIPRNTTSSLRRVFSHRSYLHICARQVILALPHVALREINWPSLRRERQRQAFDCLMTKPVSKVFLAFKQPWWLDNFKDSYVLFSDINSTFSQMYHWSCNNADLAVLLASYTCGADTLDQKRAQLKSKDMMGNSLTASNVSGKLQDLLLKNLVNRLGLNRSLIPEPISGVTQFWSGYPFGGITLMSPGCNITEVLGVVQQPSPTDQVFVVGSDFAWGTKSIWIEGGLETVDDVIDKWFYHQ